MSKHKFAVIVSFLSLLAAVLASEHADRDVSAFLGDEVELETESSQRTSHLSPGHHGKPAGSRVGGSGDTGKHQGSGDTLIETSDSRSRSRRSRRWGVTKFIKRKWPKIKWSKSGKPNCSGAKKLIHNGLMTEDCKATNKTVKGIQFMIKLRPDSAHPQWAVSTNCYDEANSANKKIWVCKKCFDPRFCPWCGRMWWKRGAKSIKRCYGEPVLINCPCTSAKGEKVLSGEAFSQIYGQLATMRISGPARNPGPNQIVSIEFDRMRMALASSIMFNCWKKRCAVNSTAAAVDIQELLSTDLELGSHTKWGGGVAC